MAASFDRVTRLFDVASGAVLADHIGCDGSVAGQMTWLAGGAAIVGVPSSAAGGTACVLDADGHPTATVVHTPGWAVPQISPDRLLYVGVLLSPLRTVVVDVPTGLELGRISGLGLMTGGGRGLVSADEALGEMMFWNLDPAVWKDRACEVAGRNLTRTEWQRYLPDEDYRVTCLQFPEES